MKLHTLLSLVILSVAVVSAEATQPLTLVKDGQPQATIVIAQPATRAAQLGAAELQWHIKAITGATLPIVTDDQKTTGLLILVGDSAKTRALGIKADSFKNQEYLVQVRRGTIILMGRDKDDRRPFNYQDPATFPDAFDEQGTCYAVYDFLEKFCDVRWYLPTELGIVHPITSTLAVRPGTVRRSPVMKYRYQTPAYVIPADLCGNTIKVPQPTPALAWREQMLWLARNRLGGEPYNVNHSFYGYYDRFLKQHPDWFAQGYEGKPPQMCYTNPDFIRQVVQDARDYFDGKGAKPGAFAQGDYFALVPMDAGAWCKCPRCRALLPDKPTRGVGQFSNDRVSDYFFGFVNQVAREVRKTHPDKFLATLGYSEYAYPPRREQLESNVAVTLCLHARNVNNRQLQENDRQILRAWRAASPSGRLSLWLYYCFPASPAVLQQFRCFPGFFARSIVREFRLYQKDHVRGLYFEPSYLADSQRSPLLDQLETWLTWKLADDPSLDGDKLISEFFARYYGAAAAPMQQLYEAIENTYSNPANYPAAAGHQTEEIAWGYLGTESRMAEFGKLMDAAHAAATTDLEKQRVALFEKGIWQYMQAGRKTFLEHSKLLAPTMQKASVPRIPSANGNPNQVDWSKAAVLGNWRTLTGEPTNRKVDARLLHDGDYLYVQLEEQLDPKKLLRASNTVWADDDWEMFIARQRAKPYRQMGVNANGVHIDLAWGEPSEHWDSGAVVVSDTTTPDRWTTRIAFPLVKLLPGGVKPGDKLFLNILRATNTGEALAWIPTFTGFHEPSRLGEIILGE